ncbi:hypothetical protein TRFO_26825 [Tritrichomonas foetus]|uniref:Uncharacterized protein n=1 Tax=Tritrichomonas foetus TaxID=1144522 RepID=A0A1J4K256_9EUKA|nr:hypothetical protein TRFO_26825 [Tritrichomonas foetus]|eukprot:OHT05471.1 hypothetical protein TRFO_26825 [Tritrichomonas foetus]
MSDSSENGSDFINGLKELGLFDEEMTENKKSKTDKKSKGKPKKSSPKRRPPKRKPINIDDIMKSMDLPIQPLTDLNVPSAPGSFIGSTPAAANPTPPTSIADNIVASIPSQQYIPMQPQINLSHFENKIIDYLNRSLKTITDEFSIEMTQLFGVNNEIEEIVSGFLDSMKQTIREEINFSVDMKPNLLNCFDNYASRFRSTYMDIEQMKNASIPEKVVELKNATATISSYIPTISNQFSHNEITNELNEINTVRTQYKISKKKQHQMKRNIFLSQLDLECKGKTQKMEADIIQTKMQRLENDRSKLDPFEDQPDRPGIASISRKLRKLTYDLSIYARKRKNKKPATQYQTISDSCQEVNYLRQLHNYQLELFNAKVEEIEQQQTQIILSKTMQSQINSIPPIPQIPYQSQFPQQYSQFPQQSIVQTQQPPIPTKSSPKVKEVHHKSNPQILSKIQDQLKSVQEKNQTSLDITSKFLSSLKRKERRRAHRHMTQILDSDNDMNSLFSLI